jgi:hypothetical protein
VGYANPPNSEETQEGAMRKSIFLLALLLASPSVAEEMAISVSKINTPLHWSNGRTTYEPSVKIVAKVDNVTIQQVILNRGNCSGEVIWTAPSGEPHSLPKSLKFGETVTLPVKCEVIEAEVKTDKGNWTFKFEK